MSGGAEAVSGGADAVEISWLGLKTRFQASLDLLRENNLEIEEHSVPVANFMVVDVSLAERPQVFVMAEDPGCLLGFRHDILDDEDEDAAEHRRRMHAGPETLKKWCHLEFSTLRKLGGVYGNCSDDKETIRYRNIHGSIMEWQRTNGKSLEAAEGIWVLRLASSAKAEDAVTDPVFYYPGIATDREPPSGRWLHCADSDFAVWVEPASAIGVYTAKHWDRRLQAAHRLAQFEEATKGASLVAMLWNLLDLIIFASWSALYLPNIERFDYWPTAIITGFICIVGIELVTEGLTTAFIVHPQTPGAVLAGFILLPGCLLVAPAATFLTLVSTCSLGWLMPSWALKTSLCFFLLPAGFFVAWGFILYTASGERARQDEDEGRRRRLCAACICLLLLLIGLPAAQLASLWLLPFTGAVPVGSWCVLLSLICACLPTVIMVVSAIFGRAVAPPKEVARNLRSDRDIALFEMGSHWRSYAVATACAHACLWHLASSKSNEAVGRESLPILWFAAVFCCRLAVRLLSARLALDKVEANEDIDTSSMADRELDVLRRSLLHIGYPQAELAKLAELWGRMKTWSGIQLYSLNDASMKAKKTKATKIAQAKHNISEMIYDISQIVVMAWVEGHVSLAHSHFPWKLLADFLNWISSLIDLIVLKGPKVVAHTAGDPSKVLELMSQTIDELEATANDAEDD